MKRFGLFGILCVMGILMMNSVAAAEPTVVVAEGEMFAPKTADGWQIIYQDQSLASHSYGGMWVSRGGLLSAEADSADAVAVTTVAIPAAGEYRVWSKYQAPPYFNYLHRIEILQGGKTLYSHVYGKSGTDRLWSFSAASDELFWSWGIDHDCAEAPKEMVKLAAGEAEIRVVTVKNPAPAGARMIDFFVLTTNPADDYVGRKPYRVGSPFTNEAFAATKFYMRFKSAAEGPLTISRKGHYQPNYGGAKQQLKGNGTAWSDWHNIGPFCRWVHDEGISVTQKGAGKVELEFALDAAGNNVVSKLDVANGGTVVIPMDITWRKGQQVLTSSEHARQIIAATNKWRTANAGKKPEYILFYGSFRGKEAWVDELKDSLGYNTQLPDKFKHVPVDGYHQHSKNEAAIRQYAKQLGPNAETMRVLSFGDEIHLGKINYNDPRNIAAFRAWLKEKGITPALLGRPIDQAVLTEKDPHQAWYTRLFNAEEKFKHYRHLTQVAKDVIGPQVLTGANYSPHYPVPAYYGPIYQWVDIFKHNGMSMFWSEDYIFSMPDVPQVISWMFGQIRCAVKYNQQPIHFYVMPHAPGQTPGNFRRNTFVAVGSGARHIDHFWVAPAENFTENYVAWRYKDQFQAIHESIYDTAEAEVVLKDAKPRAADLAVLIGKATDFNEAAAKVAKTEDPFASRCKNAPKQITQQICRREATLLYLGLKHAQHAVDVITEDDVIELDALKKYKVVYFAGEWVNAQSIPKLAAWVREGGIFYATAGCGYKNQFDQPEPAMLQLLGLEAASCKKDNYLLRTLLELVLTDPIGTVGEAKLVGMQQVFKVKDAKPLMTWGETGGAAVTVREFGKGKIYAVGSLPGHSYFKTALKVVPWGRGGHRLPYNPVDFNDAETRLLRLGLDAAALQPQVECSQFGIESLLLDNDQGTCLTLVNWTNAPATGVTVNVKSPFKPSAVRSVEQQKKLEFSYAAGVVAFSADVNEADYILLLK